jgi:hypothetical protein
MVVFEEFNGVMKMILRLSLNKIKYDDQCDMIALLDTFYEFIALGIDATGIGQGVEQKLRGKDMHGYNKYKKHNFERRAYFVNFSEKVAMPNKFNGETVFVPVKQFMTDQIIIAAQNKMIIMPSDDIALDIEAQFRNHTYTMGNNTIIYSKSSMYPDHCLIPGTMIATDKGDIAIENVVVGDKVLTRKGYENVIFSGKTLENSKIYDVELSNGTILSGTFNHPVFVKNKNNFVCMKDLQPGDEIFSVEETMMCELHQEYISNCEYVLNVDYNKISKLSQVIIGEKLCQINAGHMENQNKLNLMELRIDDIQMHKEIQIEGISGLHLLEKEKHNYYTGQFGNFIMEPFRQDIIYITKMEMLEIMILTILNVYLQKNIMKSILKQEVNAPVHQSNWNIYQKSETLQKYGMHLKKGINGILNMVKRHLKKNQYWILFATYVRNHLKAYKHVQDFVPYHVKINGIEHIIRIMEELLIVSTAEKNLEIFPMEEKHVPVYVVCVTETGRRSDVYDLTVTNTHEFFANGILVHNCIDAVRTAMFGKAMTKMPKFRSWPTGSSFKGRGGGAWG